MAKKTKSTQSFPGLKKLLNAVALVSFLVILAAGIKSEASMLTIVMRSTFVIIGYGFFCRLIIRVLVNYEEINSGKS